ncbi:MAG: hypothetical protein R6X02_35865 [Enhygromyxa sp.]
MTAALHAALHAYTAELEPARQRQREREELRRLITLEADPGPLHAFLIQWASLSVQLHEPVEQFLAEASRRCASLGESSLALKLLHVALEEIDLYRLLAEDTRALAQLWNDRRLPHLDMTSLLTQPATPAIRRSHAHQREIVLGPSPWALLASVFEVHALLASLAERILQRATRVLGEEVRPGLRTLRMLGERRARSVDRAMEALLSASPERQPVMVAVAEQTLEFYGEFLRECCVAGFNLSSWQARQQA